MYPWAPCYSNRNTLLPYEGHLVKKPSTSVFDDTYPKAVKSKLSWVIARKLKTSLPELNCQLAMRAA